MSPLLPLSFSRHAVSLRTLPPAVSRLRQPLAMPAWRSQLPPTKPEAECVVILLGRPRQASGTPTDAGRCLHAYGMRGASALCGASNWRELVPPDEATCPACRTRLGRNAVLRVQ